MNAAPIRHFRAHGQPLFALGELEAIAGAAHGLQIARILRIDLDLLTNAANIDVYRAGRDKARVAPDGVEQAIAAEDAARVRAR